MTRIGSPPSGSSILITSAPIPASSIDPYGPASLRERSSRRSRPHRSHPGRGDAGWLRRPPDGSLSEGIPAETTPRVAIVVLDASVVIALLDAGDPHHAAAVEAVGHARREELVLPSSAYAEVLVDPWRRGPDAVAVVKRFVTDLGIRIAPLTEQVAELAARLRAHHRALRLPDA